MRKSIITICGCILLFAGCKEVGPPINFHNSVAKDTTYIISSVPAPDPHNVLVEEFTGQSCPNCPAAHADLDAFIPAGQLNVIGLYIIGPTQTNKPSGGAYDLRTKVATDISADIYNGGVPGFGLPCAGIDRTPVSSSLLQYAPWDDILNQSITIIDSLNLAVTSSFSATDSIATIIATITYLQNVSTAQNLSIAVVEDSIIDFQEFPPGHFNNPENVDSFYVFNDVFRDLVTSEPLGDAILGTLALKVPGRVDQLVYSYKVKSGWNLAHCRLIAFVHYNSSEPMKSVMQSKQCKLMGP